LRLEPGHVGGVVRLPQPLDKSAARTSSASLSIRIRVASITRSPRLCRRIRHGCRRTGSPRRLPDIGGPQPGDSRYP
jgi:hypothetical protein